MVLDGRVRPIICPHLLDELAEVLSRPKIRRFVGAEEASQYLHLVAAHAEHVADPASAPPVARDPDDDYLLALLDLSQADAVVSGDLDLLSLAPGARVLSPRELVASLGS
jgi:putative PIN family toxin of toxin-antitoxin system